MHIPPEVWGPMFWATLHLVSMSYPEQPSYSEKRAAKEFFNALPFLLPCPVCRDHFAEVLKGIPVETWLDNRTSLTEWVWMAHNRVNLRLGKPEFSKADFVAEYRKMAERGLPIPPARPTAEIADEMLTAAYIRGGAHTVAALAAVGAVGALLWWSYKK